MSYLSEKQDMADSNQARYSIYLEVQMALAKADFEAVNLWIAQSCQDAGNLAVCLLRASFAARSHLPAWGILLCRTGRYLEEHLGEAEARHKLQGLEN